MNERDIVEALVAGSFSEETARKFCFFGEWLEKEGGEENGLFRDVVSCLVRCQHGHGNKAWTWYSGHGTSVYAG